MAFSQIAVLFVPVHTNGRIYDPKLGRFLQADPIVQAPKNSQNLNRYSYVLNNPLSYTDPTGYSFKSFFKKYWRVIAAVVISVITYGAASGWAAGWAIGAGYSAGTAGFIGAIVGGASAGFVSGAIVSGSLKGALKGAFVGAVSAGIAEGIAQYGFGTSTVPKAASALQLEQAGVSRGDIAYLLGDKDTAWKWGFDKNGDPNPATPSVQDGATKANLKLKIIDGKLSGDLKWACNGGAESCNSVIGYMNDFGSKNSDFTRISNQLIDDYSSADAYINFSPEFAVESPMAAGAWDEKTNIMYLNPYKSNLQRTVQHEFGHTLGLHHQWNDSLNFMSYSSSDSIVPLLSNQQKMWLKDAYEPWWIW